MLQAMLTKMSDIIWGHKTTMASGILVGVGAGNGLSPVKPQAIN